MWLETVSQSEDNTQKCPTCGGHVRRRIHGEMHAGSFFSDGIRVEIRRKPNDGYSDPIYLDPLTQYFDGGLYRLSPHDSYCKRAGKYLHRAVWESAFGEIPKHCHIHHRDGNNANNAIANLECAPKFEHLSSHASEHPSKFTQKARDNASLWHKSDEGRLWHSRMAKRSQSWTKWERREKSCPVCNKTFMALIRKSGYPQIYCSPHCKSLARNARNLIK